MILFDYLTIYYFTFLLFYLFTLLPFYLYKNIQFCSIFLPSGVSTLSGWN